jgi:glycosyltransferase involved in cell wall biosynthesis
VARYIRTSEWLFVADLSFLFRSMLHAVLLMPLAEQRGGGELMLWHLLREPAASGVRWIVVFFEDGPMVAQVRAAGAQVHVVPVGRLRQPFSMFRCVKKIAKIVRDEQATLIFSWMPKAHLYGGLVSAITGVPTGWYQLGMPSKMQWLDWLPTVIPARGVLACSKAGAEAQGRMWPSRLPRVVHPGAELDRFDAAKVGSGGELRKKLGLPATGPIIGIVGRLQRWKGIHVLIEAMPRILIGHADAHCVIVGGTHDPEPTYRAYLDSRIQALGLKNQITMAGLQKNVPEWMAAMDVVVHASDREPFGIVIIEAMALGKPVVANDTAGPTEIITNGVDGLLTPFENADALADAVLRYLDHPAFAAQVGAAAWRRAQDFSTARFAHNVTTALCEMADCRQPFTAEPLPQNAPANQVSPVC